MTPLRVLWVWPNHGLLRGTMGVVDRVAGPAQSAEHRSLTFPDKGTSVQQSVAQ